LSSVKLAVVGCGAVGSFYGAKLCRAGQEVHFLLRTGFDTVRREGVWVRSVEGDFRIRPYCAATPREIGPCQVVLIALKTTANHQFPVLVPPLVGPDSLVVTLQNGLDNEEQLAAVVGPEKVLGGLCFVCLNRLEPGVVVHSAHGRIELGEFQGPPTERTRRLAEMLRHAQIPCEVVPDLSRAHWEKLVWNIPFNGLGVAGVAGYDAVLAGRISSRAPLGPCLPTDQLLNHAGWAALVRELMAEIITVANALGIPVPHSLAEYQISRTLCMGAYKASTLLDFEKGKALELDSIFLRPLHYARRAGVAAPRLEALAAILGQLNPAAD
jgi:2-dehydropantoate 2-reductase